MKTKSIWLKWPVMLGAVSLAIGLAWIVIWTYSVQRGEPVGSIAYELHPPIGSRLMVLVGIIALILAAIGALVRRLRCKPAAS